jgi:alpha-tubulin suppressor-like RCC1 family protein
MSRTIRWVALVSGLATVGLMFAACTPPAGSDPVVDVAAGGGHTCAVRRSGKVLCWGENGPGTLGNGTNTDSTTPTPVIGLSDAIAIASGNGFSCAIRRLGGTVDCWGLNHAGALGNGTTTNSNVPVPVSGVTNAMAIAAGDEHACALISGGAIQCWGQNGDGELGNGSTVNSSTPVTVTGPPAWTAVSAGGNDTCAIDTSAHAACWGANDRGQLGAGLDPTSVTHVASPSFDVTTGLAGPPLGPVTSIGVGERHNCAVVLNQAYCWGDQTFGLLGNGLTTPPASPFAVQVTGLNVAAQVSAGASSACSALALGGVDCWGQNFAGQFGNGTTAPSLTFVVASGLTSISKVTVGAAHACALRSDGTVSCWGLNITGQIGNGTTTTQLTPATVL